MGVFSFPQNHPKEATPIPKLKDSQIQAARDIDLLSYLQTHAPHSIRKSGANEYCLVEHDSFKISNGYFNWFSRGIGGRGALDYLIKVEGMDFVSAVQTLTGRAAPIYKRAVFSRKQTTQPKPFKLPAHNRNNDRVYAYLRGRGIGKEIINRCINAGLLYESAGTHRCVFVGKDGDTPKFACERGTRDDWKKDVAGSDKRFGFHLPPRGDEYETLVVFESAVDVLAHQEICHVLDSDSDGYSLSLSGTSSLALLSFLERNPQIKEVDLCLDNDEAGRNASRRIVEELAGIKKLSHLRVMNFVPPHGKDYADSLAAIQQQHNQQSTRNYADIAI